MVGFATSFTRELMWILASFAVRPALQGGGVGRALLEPRCTTGAAASAGCSTPRRTRRPPAATGRPASRSTRRCSSRGTVDRSVLPVVEHVREGSAGDIDLLDSIDRRTRGAAHGSDHLVLTESFRLLVTDRPAGSGYAYVRTDGSPVLLAATDRRTATTLAWEAFAASSPGRTGDPGPRHRRERVGGRRRDGRPAGPPPARLPRDPAHEAAQRRTCRTGCCCSASVGDVVAGVEEREVGVVGKDPGAGTTPVAPDLDQAERPRAGTGRSSPSGTPRAV